jgi:hypothetical protein
MNKYIPQHVKAYTIPGEFYGEGKVIGLHDQPSYIIETPDGERFCWLVRLCKEVKDD